MAVDVSLDKILNLVEKFAQKFLMKLVMHISFLRRDEILNLIENIIEIIFE